MLERVILADEILLLWIFTHCSQSEHVAYLHQNMPVCSQAMFSELEEAVVICEVVQSVLQLSKFYMVTAAFTFESL